MNEFKINPLHFETKKAVDPHIPRANIKYVEVRVRRFFKDSSFDKNVVEPSIILLKNNYIFIVK